MNPYDTPVPRPTSLNARMRSHRFVPALLAGALGVGLVVLLHGTPLWIVLCALLPGMGLGLEMNP